MLVQVQNVTRCDVIYGCPENVQKWGVDRWKIFPCLCDVFNQVQNERRYNVTYGCPLNVQESGVDLPTEFQRLCDMFFSTSMQCLYADVAATAKKQRSTDRRDFYQISTLWQRSVLTGKVS